MTMVGEEVEKNKRRRSGRVRRAAGKASYLGSYVDAIVMRSRRCTANGSGAIDPVMRDPNIWQMGSNLAALPMVRWTIHRFY